MPTLGCVPYLNAKPLTAAFERGAIPGIEVRYEVPSRLPAMLASGEVGGILVSSIESLRHPEFAYAPGVSISTQRAVESVRLFHRKSLHEVRSLALDQSSMTSNALAQIVLGERYGVRPSVTPLAPDVLAMLEVCDAAVLIGDNGMRPAPEGVTATDLGEEWFQMTGAPFVWAVWILKDLSLAEPLLEAREWGEAHLDEIIHTAASQTGFSVEVASHYLRDVMDYRLDEAHRRGLAEFGRKAAAHGLLPELSTISAR